MIHSNVFSNSTTAGLYITSSPIKVEAVWNKSWMYKVCSKNNRPYITRSLSVAIRYYSTMLNEYGFLKWYWQKFYIKNKRTDTKVYVDWTTQPYNYIDVRSSSPNSLYSPLLTYSMRVSIELCNEFNWCVFHEQQQRREGSQLVLRPSLTSSTAQSLHHTVLMLSWQRQLD